MTALRLSDARFLILLGAIGLYALIGSPTPDGVGIVEAIIAAGLMIAIGWRGVGAVLDRAGLVDTPLWFNAGCFAFLYLIFSGAAQFLYYGHEAADAARDVVALGFMFLPLFLYTLMKGDDGRYSLLFGAVLLAGFLFAFRSLSLFISAPIFTYLNSDALSYLANAPSVLFCGMFCALYIVRVFTGQSAGRALYICAAILVVGTVLAAITLTMQRASILALALSVLIIAGKSFVVKPQRAALVGMCAGLLAALLWPLLYEIALAFSFKNRTAGANMRIEDLRAIWAAISDTPLTFLFGLGFGGNFQSPAVGGYTVNFAHGLFSAALLKHGVLGVVVVMMYMGALFRELLKMSAARKDIFLALAAPFVICIFLYASYKSLDFGLLLCLIAFSSVALSGASRNLR